MSEVEIYKSGWILPTMWSTGLVSVSTRIVPSQLFVFPVTKNRAPWGNTEREKQKGKTIKWNLTTMVKKRLEKSFVSLSSEKSESTNIQRTLQSKWQESWYCALLQSWQTLCCQIENTLALWAVLSLLQLLNSAVIAQK